MHGGVIYDLMGVVRHHGKTLSSGHYTTYALSRNLSHAAIRGPLQWLHYDDSTVTAVEPNDIHGLQAYLLFYSRRPHGASPPVLTPIPKPVPPPTGTAGTGNGQNSSPTKKPAAATPSTTAATKPANIP
jgi:hypothetical protein